MAIRKKPEPKPSSKPSIEPSKEMRVALAFVEKASVNQSILDSEETDKDTKRLINLKLWASELAQIDKAVANAAANQPYARNRITRHGWILEAIFEKIKRTESN